MHDYTQNGATRKMMNRTSVQFAVNKQGSLMPVELSLRVCTCVYFTSDLLLAYWFNSN